MLKTFLAFIGALVIGRLAYRGLVAIHDEQDALADLCGCESTDG